MIGAVDKYYCGDIWTWLQDTGEDRIFRYWVYKRMYTPYEQEQKFIDEGVFEDSYCKFGVITECIQLPDNDLLIGFRDVIECGDCSELTNGISYYKLSEIRMEYCQEDDKMLCKIEEE